jgi:hypothetical protein
MAHISYRDNIVHIYVIDAITGKTLHHVQHENANGPVTLLQVKRAKLESD